MPSCRTVVACVVFGFALAVYAAPARAGVEIGCFSFGMCRPGDPFGVMPRECSSGRDCDDPGACVFAAPGDLTGLCLVPTSRCEYCLLPSSTECPEAAIGSRGRQTPPLTIAGCAYAICGDSRYVVDGDAPDFPSLAPCFTGPFLNWWGGGDCDEDGLVNDLDRGEAVCFANRPVARVADGAVTCERGTFVFNPVATRSCSVVSTDPLVQACVEDGVLPFGVCCTQVEECPQVPMQAARCVRLPGARGDEGVCTYGREIPPLDTSCLTATSGALCEDPSAPTAYFRWANGNCDADCDPMGTTNGNAEQVCGCRPDAGVDAAMPDAAAPPDAGTQLDSSSLDAGPPIDASSAPPARFGGSGVQCSAQRGGDGTKSDGTMLLVLGLAIAISSRRVAAWRGARSRSAGGSRRCS